MTKKKPENSALNVQKGIEQPSQVNPALSGGLEKFRKQKPSVEEYAESILKGDRTMLSRAITLIESVRPEDKTTGRELINKCLPHSGKSVRIGITGIPGAGKSTFIEAFGIYLIEQGHKVAVLAIDPTSQRSKGSILGDKTRMESLSAHPHAFIRPSATSGTLGGVARATREAVILCEAAGFDMIIIETVGVGQSETAVAQIVDFFLLLMIAGAGDELQGIKRGIMEMADLVVINKADGDNLKKAELARKEYENALHLFPPLPSGWTSKVLTASALYAKGLDEILEVIRQYVDLARQNGWFEKNRQGQSLKILHDAITIAQSLSDSFYHNPEIKKLIPKTEKQIIAGKQSPYEAAQILLEKYFEIIKGR
ncbi:MAG: methylmalonyl Co-A mutase-associated GTPase MeaB [Chlorobi bacterium]|nr:methylmalonyl Co-A mutase-associated GTPase MeaB [Chlorobiota bacterium]